MWLIEFECTMGFSALITVFGKTTSFQNEAYTFLYQKNQALFCLMLPIRIFYKSAKVNWYSGSISLLISLLSGAKR